MALKDMLVHLDGTRQAAARLDCAAALAARHGSHLVGLHTVEFHLPSGITADAGGAALGMLMRKLREDAAAEAEQQRHLFEERIRRDGLSGEWRAVQGQAAATVALHARYADLAMLGQPDPDSAGAMLATEVLEAVLFTSGRPVLMVPYAGHFGAPGQRVLIGWNAGKEAARAVADALPLLVGAEQVTVVAINPRLGIGGHGDVPAADIALHLARHGVVATAQHAMSGSVTEADTLLNMAADLDVDLLVMGAYGHSRLREMVFGGVTRGILARMTVPVLMAH
jgi:nucleotide-binding universal stress UspA family protein